MTQTEAEKRPRPDGVGDATVKAVAAVSEALECVERARGVKAAPEAISAEVCVDTGALHGSVARRPRASTSRSSGSSSDVDSSFSMRRTR